MLKWYRYVVGRPYRFGIDGSVWSKVGGEWKELTPTIDKFGYKRIHIDIGKGCYCQYLARLILTAFVGKPKFGQIVIWKDKDKMNCSVANLRWGYRWEKKLGR